MTAFQPIRDAMKILTSKSANPTSEEDKNILDSQLQALSAYEEKVVSEFRTLQIENSPPPTSVLRIYQSAFEETKKAIENLNGDVTTSRLILNNFEQVTNFCTNVLTKENGVKFFDTKGFDIEEVVKANGEIKESWDSFIKENSGSLSITY